MAVSEFPEYIRKNRNVSSVNNGQTPRWPTSTWQPPRQGTDAIHNPDGSIITGNIPTWRSLSSEDRDIVYKERKRLGYKGTKGNPNVLRSRSKYASNSYANKVRQLQDQNSQYKRQIRALTRNDFNPTPNSGNSDNEHSVIDAGDTFGGRNNKAGKRRQNK